MTPFETKLAKIKDRAEAATPGPWFARVAPEFVTEQGYASYGHGPVVHQTPRDQPIERAQRDALFIAAARTDVPALIAALRRAIEQRDYYMSEYHSTRKQEEKCDHELAKILEGGK